MLLERYPLRCRLEQPGFLLYASSRMLQLQKLKCSQQTKYPVSGGKRHAQPTQTVVNLQQLIREDPANNVLPMIDLH